jgi:hypothetical protein
MWQSQVAVGARALGDEEQAIAQAMSSAPEQRRRSGFRGGEPCAESREKAM